MSRQQSIYADMDEEARIEAMCMSAQQRFDNGDFDPDEFNDEQELDTLDMLDMCESLDEEFWEDVDRDWEAFDYDMEKYAA